MNLSGFVKREQNIKTLEKFQLAETLVIPQDTAERMSYSLSQKNKLVLASQGRRAPSSNDQGKAARSNSWVCNFEDDLRRGICRVLVVW